MVGDRRCAQDILFCRALGLGGHCSSCDDQSCSPSCLNWRYCRNPQSPSNPQSSTERFSPWNPRSKELTTTTAIPLHCPSPLLPTSARRLKAAVLVDIHGNVYFTVNKRSQG